MANAETAIREAVELLERLARLAGDVDAAGELKRGWPGRACRLAGIDPSNVTKWNKMIRTGDFKSMETPTLDKIRAAVTRLEGGAQISLGAPTPQATARPRAADLYADRASTLRDVLKGERVVDQDDVLAVCAEIDEASGSLAQLARVVAKLWRQANPDGQEPDEDTASERVRTSSPPAAPRSGGRSRARRHG